MNKKFSIFIEISKELNRYGILPTIYGSLGASRLIKVKDIDDIDIIISDTWLTNRFAKFKRIMAGIGFKQDSQYPHEFNRVKSEGHVGFEKKSELKKDMGVNSKNIKITKINGIKFGELSAKDYLKVYNKTAQLYNGRMTKIQYKIKELEKLL
ncbi:MAG: hypothetical protein WCT37_01845 [Patescibacteria group bacterium]|jgi:hypothetical protein